MGLPGTAPGASFQDLAPVLPLIARVLHYEDVLVLACASRDLSSGLAQAEVDVVHGEEVLCRRFVRDWDAFSPSTLLRAFGKFRVRRLSTRIERLCRTVFQQEGFYARIADFQQMLGAFEHLADLDLWARNERFDTFGAVDPSYFFSLEWVAAMRPQLQRLAIHNVAVTDLVALRELPSLTALVLDRCPVVPDASFPAAAKAGRAGNPDADFPEGAPDSSYVSDCYRVLSLVCDLRRTAIELDDLPELPNLTSLSLLNYGRSGFRSLDFLVRFQQLDELVITGAALQTLEALAHVPTLRTLKLEEWWAPLPSLEPVGRALAELRTLSLRRIRRRNAMTDLTPLMRCTALESVDLSGVLAENIEDLAAMWPRLRVLVLEHTPLLRIWRLARCAGLESLDLRHRPNSDGGGLLELAQLSHLAELKTAELCSEFPSRSSDFQSTRLEAGGIAPLLGKFPPPIRLAYSTRDAAATLQALAAAETGRGLGGVEYAGGMQAELLAAASGGLSGAALFETLEDVPDVTLAPAAPAIDVEALRAVLARGAFPDCCDAFGSTPVFYAVLHGCEESLALLLEAQADPSLRPWDRVRYSPLEWAVLLDRRGCARRLWDAGAEPFGRCGPSAAAAAERTSAAAAAVAAAATVADGFGAVPPRLVHAEDFARALGRHELAGELQQWTGRR